MSLFVKKTGTTICLQLSPYGGDIDMEESISQISIFCKPGSSVELIQ